MNKIISVIGSDESDKNLSKYAIKTAEDVGKLIADKKGILICGGRGGIMKAVCKGAKEKNGITVGILPKSKEEVNKFVDIPIITGLGNIRNSIIVYTCDAIIAIAGREGTLNEISYSMIYNKPLILVKGTGGIVDKICNKELEIINNSKNIYLEESAIDAVGKAFNLISP